jgi:hypothetical protein
MKTQREWNLDERLRKLHSDRIAQPLIRQSKQVSCLQPIEKVKSFESKLSIAFSCHGARIGIQANTNQLLDEIIKILPPGWRSLSGTWVDDLYSIVVSTLQTRKHDKTNTSYELYLGSICLIRTRDLNAMIRQLNVSLHLSVAARARRRLFIHSGVVGWKNNAILIPGQSMTGKTSLVRALVENGGTFLSDEYASVDRNGFVYPYPKPMHIRMADNETVEVEADKFFNKKYAIRRLPVKLILFTEYSENAHWRPKKISPGNALLDLLNYTLIAQLQPDKSLEYLKSLVINALCIKSKRGEAHLLTEKIMQYLE